MNLKKLCAAVTAACTVAVSGVFPTVFDHVSAYEAVHNDFEVSYEGWHESSPGVTVTAIDGKGADGSRGMLVSGRTSPEDGAQSSKGFYLSGGNEYNYSFSLYTEKEQDFNITLTYADEKTNEEKTETIISEKVDGGKWTTLSADFKAPQNTCEYRITIASDSTDDYYFDDVIIKGEKDDTTVYAADDSKGLKDEFAAYFKVGNILNGGTIQNSDITANILKNYNSIECENETKPQYTMDQTKSSGTNVAVTLSSCAAIAEFCERHNISMRGHTLVWHSQTPLWFFKQDFSQYGNWVNTSVMNSRLESYIKNMFYAFKTQYPNLDLYAYDVCNECMTDDYNRDKAANGARQPGENNNGDGTSPWVQIYGNNSFMNKAFEYARAYAPPTCKLYYNDYNEYMSFKMDRIYEKCSELYKAGLLDGVGMQSHVPSNATGFAGTEDYLKAMEKYLSIGCDVQVTELDVSLIKESDQNGNPISYYTEKEQAAKYKAIFEAAMDYNTSGKYKGKVTAVCIWGPNDANSWLHAGSNALLFDKNNQPKLAYNELTSIIPYEKWGTAEGATVEPNEYGWYFHDSFENEECGWNARGTGEATITSSSDTKYTKYGTNSLYVSNRKSAWNGASKKLDTRAFKAGETYSFSAHVNYLEGSTTDKFFLKLQYSDPSDLDSDGKPKTKYDKIAEATGIKDTWVQLVNTEYTIPANAQDMYIYVETEDSTIDFYIDEAIGALGGTGIAGEGQPEVPGSLVAGDTDFNKKLNVFDLIIIKKGLISGFKDSKTESAADVNGDRVVDTTDIELLTDFLLGKITEFPKADPIIDMDSMDNLFSGITLASSYKKDGENNPINTQRFGADPGWMVYKDRLYIYTTNDAFEYYQDGRLQINTYNSGTINCLSTSDMVNWTDHGAIPVADLNSRTTNGVAKWASAAWAPDACWKTIDGKDKFFLYFANSGGGIGVLTADSPTGPWTDPIEKPLLDWSTNGNKDVVWMFDPGVYYDPETNEGYIAYGGGDENRDKANPKTGRIAKLGSDMISIVDNTVTTMETPYLFEDSSLIKIGKKWYYSYCTNWNAYNKTVNGVNFNSGEICYMTSENPLGPWKEEQLTGKLLPGTGVVDKGGNNHHSIIYFKDKYYVAYHTRAQALRMGITAISDKEPNNREKDSSDGNYRSTHINEAKYDPSTGKISCNIDMKGASQIESLDPFKTVQAETMSNQSKDVSVSGLQNTTVNIKKGGWIKVSGAAFSKAQNYLTVKASSKNGAVIKVCTGSEKGSAMTYVEIPSGSSMSEITVPVVEQASGIKDLYFVCSGDVSFDEWSFS